MSLHFVALKIMHPRYVYLNRGNHESEKYNIATVSTMRF